MGLRKGFIFPMSCIALLLPTSPFIFFMPLSTPWIIEGGEWERVVRGMVALVLINSPMN